jgi:hypothetical protein
MVSAGNMDGRESDARNRVNIINVRKQSRRIRMVGKRVASMRGQETRIALATNGTKNTETSMNHSETSARGPKTITVDVVAIIINRADVSTSGMKVIIKSLRATRMNTRGINTRGNKKSKRPRAPLFPTHTLFLGLIVTLRTRKFEKSGEN